MRGQKQARTQRHNANVEHGACVLRAEELLRREACKSLKALNTSGRCNLEIAWI